VISYTIRKMPRTWTRRDRHGEAREWALFSPAGQIIATSWHPRSLWRLCDQLNDAYQLGLVTGRLARRGRPQKLDPDGEAHLDLVASLPEWQRFPNPGRIIRHRKSGRF
jgi:hypothetical protein